MFLLVAVRHAGAQPDGNSMASPYKSLLILWKHFFAYLLYDIFPLGEGLCIFTSFHFPDSGLCLLNGFDFYFGLFWMAWHWKPAYHLRNFGSHVTLRPPARPSTTGGSPGECHFLASVGACNMILHIDVVVNWQLSKQGSHWPVSHDHIAGSSIHPSRLRFLLKLSAEGLLVFIWSQAQLQADFFAVGKTHWKKHTRREKTGWFAEKFSTLKEISEPASGRLLFPMSLLSVKQWK